MTVKEAIDRADAMKPNTYQLEDKLRWLSFLEAQVYNEVINTHHPLCAHNHEFDGFEDYDLEIELAARFPHDEIYPAYIKMKIDEETERLQGSIIPLLFSIIGGICLQSTTTKNISLFCVSSKSTRRVYESTIFIRGCTVKRPYDLFWWL